MYVAQGQTIIFFEGGGVGNFQKKNIPAQQKLL